MCELEYCKMKEVVIVGITLFLSGCNQATIYDPEKVQRKIQACLDIGMLPQITLPGGNSTRWTKVNCVEKGRTGE